MKKIVALLSAVAVVGVTYNSIAQDMTPEEQAAAAVDQRKSLFKTIRYNLGPIVGMAQGAPFDAEIAGEGVIKVNLEFHGWTGDDLVYTFVDLLTLMRGSEQSTSQLRIDPLLSSSFLHLMPLPHQSLKNEVPSSCFLVVQRKFQHLSRQHPVHQIEHGVSLFSHQP